VKSTQRPLGDVIRVIGTLFTRVRPTDGELVADSVAMPIKYGPISPEAVN